jgi:hypothetical protein
LVTVLGPSAQNADSRYQTTRRYSLRISFLQVLRS